MNLNPVTRHHCQIPPYLDANRWSSHCCCCESDGATILFIAREKRIQFQLLEYAIVTSSSPQRRSIDEARHILASVNSWCLGIHVWGQGLQMGMPTGGDASFPSRRRAPKNIAKERTPQSQSFRSRFSDPALSHPPLPSSVSFGTLPPHNTRIMPLRRVTMLISGRWLWTRATP